MSGKTVLCALAMLATAAGAQAQAVALAKIETVTGSVMAVQAKGGAEAKAGLSLSRGDRIVARTGEAHIRYTDGCAVTVKAGTMAVIAARSPCAGGAGLVQSQSANPAQVKDVFRHLDTATIVAGVGSIALVAAVIDGVFNADSKCDPINTTTCNADGSASG